MPAGYRHPSNSPALPSVDYEVMVFETRQAAAKASPLDVSGGLAQAFKANDKLDAQTNMDAFSWEQLGISAWKGVRQVKLLGMTGSAYIKVIKGKEYIIFRGLPGSRPELPGTIYARSNPKVSCFVVGAEELMEDGLKTARLGIIVYAAVDVTKEVVSPPEVVPGQPPGFSLIDLGVHLSCDLLKFVVATAAGIAAGVVITTMVAGALPVVAVFAVSVGVGVFAGMVLDRLDTRFDLSGEMSRLCRTWFWHNATAQSFYQSGEDWLSHGESYVQGEVRLIRSRF